MKRFFTHGIKNWINMLIEKDLLAQSAALSYYSALSLAPLLILAVSIFSLLGPGKEQAFLMQVRDVLGLEASKAISVIIESAQKNEESRAVSSFWGILTLLISSSAVFAQLRETIAFIFKDTNDVSEKAKAESNGIIEFLKDRVFSIGMMVTFIFISLVSLAFSAFIGMALPAGEGLALAVLNFLISLIIYSLSFFLVFRFVPERRVRTRDALLGGLITSLLFMFGKSLIGVYLGSSAVGSSYGAAGSFVVLLVWVYYSSFIVFSSAAIVKLLPELRVRKPFVPTAN